MWDGKGLPGCQGVAADTLVSTSRRDVYRTWWGLKFPITSHRTISANVTRAPKGLSGSHPRLRFGSQPPHWPIAWPGFGPTKCKICRLRLSFYVVHPTYQLHPRIWRCGWWHVPAFVYDLSVMLLLGSSLHCSLWWLMVCRVYWLRCSVRCQYRNPRHPTAANLHHPSSTREILGGINGILVRWASFRELVIQTEQTSLAS